MVLCAVTGSRQHPRGPCNNGTNSNKQSRSRAVLTVMFVVVVVWLLSLFAWLVVRLARVRIFTMVLSCQLLLVILLF